MPYLKYEIIAYLFLLVSVVSARDDEIGYGHTQHDPTIRRILLLLLIPITAVAGWVGFRAYFPEQESKQSENIAKSIKKAKAKLPGWWEGGALGEGSNLQTLHDTGEISAHLEIDINPPEQPPMEMDLKLTKTIEKQKSIPPISNTTTCQQQLPKISEDSIHIQEPIQRTRIDRSAMEGYIQLLRECDLEVRRVNLTQQKHLFADESTTREYIRLEEDNDYSKVFMKIWEDSAAIQQISDNETDVRYAVVYGERCQYAELVVEMHDSYLIASTAKLRYQLSDDENQSRISIQKLFIEITPPLLLAINESIERFIIEEDQLCDLEKSFNQYWSCSRILLQNDIDFYISELDLRENSSRLLIRSVESQIILELGGAFRSEKCDLSTKKMRVVVNGAVVRESSDRRSAKVGVLSENEIVQVEEIKYGRALLRLPRGWVSIENQAGMTILEELSTDSAEGSVNENISSTPSTPEPKIKSAVLSNAISSVKRSISSPKHITDSRKESHESDVAADSVVDSPSEIQTPVALSPTGDVVNDEITDDNSPSPSIHTPQTKEELVPLSVDKKPSLTIETPQRKPVLMSKKQRVTPSKDDNSVTLYTKVVSRNIIVKTAPTRNSAKSGTLVEGDIVEIERELVDKNLVLIKNPRGWIPAACLKGAHVHMVSSWSPVSQDYSQTTPPRSPSLASFASSVQSTLIDDFREIVLHKSEEQKLGICFADKSRLVLESCVDGSASQQNGLESVLGHRLIKINGINVREKPDVVPFVKETTLHLVFSKSADPGWDAATQTWSRRRKSSTPSPAQVADKFASIAFSGFQGIKKWSSKSEKPTAAVSKLD